MEVLRNSPDCDVAVSNGWREVDGRREAMRTDMNGVAALPLETLLKQNWLASCSAAYRSASIGAEYFEQLHGFAEWTWLGYRLCLTGKKFGVVTEHDYVIHDTPQSLSKDGKNSRAYVELFKRMLSQQPPKAARRRIRAKLGATYHDLSVEAIAAGRLSEATRFHFQSLGLPDGLQYMLYARRILVAWFRRLQLRRRT